MEAIPQILVGGVESLVEWQRCGLLSEHAPIDSLAVVLVGYSESKRRIIGRVFEQTDRATGFVSSDIPRSYLAPCDSDDCVIAKLPAPSNREAMTMLARAQVRRVEEIVPEVVR